MQPNKKILEEYEKNIKLFSGEPFNFLHFRYEADMINSTLNRNISFVIPPVDEILKYFKFKNEYKIFISTNDAKGLHEKKLLLNEFNTYDNFVCKLENNLNYDQNAFLELLIGLKSEEVCGNSRSGFPTSLNLLKGTNNYYDKIPELQKYNIQNKGVLESYNIQHIDWKLVKYNE